MEIRTCTKCKQELTIDNFYRKGDTGYHTYCKPCNTKETLIRQRKIKIDALDYKGGPHCSICGYNKYVGALQFHHLDPNEKDLEWSKFKTRKFDDRFKAELDKCIVVCANCHFEIHHKE